MTADRSGNGGTEHGQGGTHAPEEDAHLVDALDVLPVVGRRFPFLEAVEVMTEDRRQGGAHGLIDMDRGLGFDSFCRHRGAEFLDRVVFKQSINITDCNIIGLADEERLPNRPRSPESATPHAAVVKAMNDLILGTIFHL